MLLRVRPTEGFKLHENTILILVGLLFHFVQMGARHAYWDVRTLEWQV